jgi:hypothetical protein
MSLTIQTSFVPSYFESILITPLQFTAAGSAPGNTLTWSLKELDDQNLPIPLPTGLTFSSTGVLSGTPASIARPGSGSISGTAGTKILTVTSTQNPGIFSGSEVLVGVSGVSYKISGVSSVGNVYTLKTFVEVEAGGYSGVTYQVVPLGNARNYPIEVLLQEKDGPTLIQEVSKEFTITVLKLNNNEVLFTFLDQATNSSGLIEEDVFKSALNQLPAQQRNDLLSIGNVNNFMYDAATNTYKNYVYLAPFSTNDVSAYVTGDGT